MNPQKFELVIIVLLLGCIGMMKYCNKPPVVTTITKTVTVPGDKVFTQVKVNVPVPVYCETVKHDTVTQYQKIDTAEILDCFFKRYVYRDTINDSTVRAIIQEIISQNRIVNRQVWFQNLREKQVTYQTTIIQQQTGLFIGPQLTFGSKFGIGAGAMYIRDKNGFGCNVDLINRSFGVSYFRLLK